MVAVMEHRSPHMADHANKVQHYATTIAKEMELSQRVIKRIQIAAMLHDIGMIAIPDAVLLNPNKLDEQQLQVVRRHPLLSVRIMEGMEFLEQEIPAVRYHHERYDGKGYPEGISGPAIPLTARILTVADAFDAMTSPRSFRQAFTPQEALKELKQESGKQFDPDVVDAMLSASAKMGDKLMEIPARRKSNTEEIKQAWANSSAKSRRAADTSAGLDVVDAIVNAGKVDPIRLAALTPKSQTNTTPDTSDS
jgi:HD-GYP domain-containing protein (c-di-GMP phosphodiesterase class II)